ncbi:hypothetical protein J437_LFUL016713 [Ladona fulva]|uniref:Uncharacterized protein n=1 Tax=Ladona fulva TaxID=123851 RepID=A0A8K0KM79_LADFU|nr:hypothetical protein J437_LFUL016713 [Ladona fulva]
MRAKKVLGSNHEFHFLHRALPHARTRRSIPHTRKLKAHPMVLQKHTLSVEKTYIGLIFAIKGLKLKKKKSIPEQFVSRSSRSAPKFRGKRGGATINKFTFGTSGGELRQLTSN